MKNLLIVNILFFIVFCTTWESPYDPDNPDYVYPFFKVDSIASTFLDKDTIIDSIPQMVVFGNDVKSQFRWRLDSTSWCEWIEKGTKSFAISLDVVDTGWHTLDVQTCYNPNAHVADSTFKFYRACCPAITDSFCMLTTTVIKGSGTIQVEPAGANFDPGTDIQITAIPGTGYVFKKWSGSVNDASKNNPTISVTMNGDKHVMASFTKKIETITLNNGESVIHGSLYVNGYFFISTRTSPAKLLRFNADSISDYQEISFSSGHSYADQITYVTSKNKLYVVFGASYRTAIAEVDPITMTYNENAIVDTFHGASPVLETNGGQSI